MTVDDVVLIGQSGADGRLVGRLLSRVPAGAGILSGCRRAGW
jgi:hypothetical protein